MGTRSRDDATVSISRVELMALKKLALINGALAKTLGDGTAGREQRALLRVLIDVVNRAELALALSEATP